MSCQTVAWNLKIVLAKEILKYAEVTITPKSIQFKKFSSNEDKGEERKMMQINTSECEYEKFNIDSSASKLAKEEEHSIIANYKPNKIKSTEVEMRIIVKDDSPIWCTP